MKKRSLVGREAYKFFSKTPALHFFKVEFFPDDAHNRFRRNILCYKTDIADVTPKQYS